MNWRTLKPIIDSAAYLIRQLELIELKENGITEHGIDMFDKDDVWAMRRQGELYIKQLDELILTIKIK